MKRAVSPERLPQFPNAIELSANRRCPWLDIFIHKDWVQIFIFPLPSNSSVRIQSIQTIAFVVIEGAWNFPRNAPVTEADALRSARPREFVFKIDLIELGVDLGTEPVEQSGYDWKSFRFSRF